MPGMQFGHGFGRYAAWGHGLGIWHIIFVVTMLVAVALFAVWVVSYVRRPHHAIPPVAPAHPAIDPALHEARVRYARGELTRDQFISVNRDLGGAEPPPVQQ